MDPIVTVSNVGKSYRRYHPDRPGTIQEAVAKGLRRMRHLERFWGLRDISFTVPAGRTVGIVGANGSGKSTLLRLIGGVGRPDTGRIDVHGRIGALLDLSAGFHPELTGRENAILAGILNGLTRKASAGAHGRDRRVRGRSKTRSTIRSGRSAPACRCGWDSRSRCIRSPTS
jgi:lipopolysaccharide transport system ATP-binding protein